MMSGSATEYTNDYSFYELLDADFFDEETYAFYAHGAPFVVIDGWRRRCREIAEVVGIVGMIAILCLVLAVKRK